MRLHQKPADFLSWPTWAISAVRSVPPYHSGPLRRCPSPSCSFRGQNLVHPDLDPGITNLDRVTIAGLTHIKETAKTQRVRRDIAARRLLLWRLPGSRKRLSAAARYRIFLRPRALCASALVSRSPPGRQGRARGPSMWSGSFAAIWNAASPAFAGAEPASGSPRGMRGETTKPGHCLHGTSA